MTLQIVKVIPYKTFKQRIRIVKQHIGKARIEVCDRYIIVVKFEEELQ